MSYQQLIDRGWSPAVAAQVGAAVWPLGLLSVEARSLWAGAKAGNGPSPASQVPVPSCSAPRSSPTATYANVLLAWQHDPLAASVGPLARDGLVVISGFALLAMSQTSEIIDEHVRLSEAASTRRSSRRKTRMDIRGSRPTVCLSLRHHPHSRHPVRRRSFIFSYKLPLFYDGTRLRDRISFSTV